jgi:hypothetical protein
MEGRACAHLVDAVAIVWRLALMCAAGVVIIVAAAPAIAATSVASTPKNMDLASSLYRLAFNSTSPLLLGVLRLAADRVSG